MFQQECDILEDIEQLIAVGQNLLSEGTEAQAIAYFTALAARFPDSARAQFEAGGAYDFDGQESEAVPFYERAIALGLPAEDQPRVAVQLGSTLRNLGRYDESLAVLENGIRQFPHYRALRAFLALTLVTMGKGEMAVATLLDTLIDMPGPLEAYTRSLRAYAAELRQQGQDADASENTPRADP